MLRVHFVYMLLLNLFIRHSRGKGRPTATTACEFLCHTLPEASRKGPYRCSKRQRITVSRVKENEPTVLSKLAEADCAGAADDTNENASA